MKEEFQVEFMHDVTLRKREGFTHKAADPLPQGAIPPFHMIGLSRILSNHLVLSGMNHRCIGLPEVGINPSSFIIWRNPIPKFLTTRTIPVPNKVGHHLTRTPAKGNPNPPFIAFTANKRP